jgi:3-dehydroquinate synthase
MGNFAPLKSPAMESLNVRPVFPENPAAYLKEILEERNPSSVWLLCDRNTKKHCLPLLSDALTASASVISLPPGEGSKTLDSCESIWRLMTRKNADRKALLLCLGGGMIGDLGAFAASVYKRGIDFVLIPTSLLAMADACMGGKAGVDFDAYKNQLGTFSKPSDIIIVPDFLKTLLDVELLSGLAEICKHALCGDAAAWHRLRKSEVHRQDWPMLIQASLEYKARITEEDPQEKSQRKILNAGHTIGHALESYFLAAGNPQPHGHCVAAGLIAEGRLAVEKGLLAESELLQVEEFIYAEFGVLPFGRKDIPKISRNCLQDKKNRDGKVMTSLFGPIGKGHIDQEVTESDIRRALRYYLGF